MPSSDLEATVFIPTYRGARYIEDLVRSVFAQTYDRDFEVLVYDTDSGDESPAILQRLADEFGDRFRWKSVAKKEFSHGRTRAAAALDAHGEFVAFLTQDATPANGRWLYELLKPFELNERIVAVLGKQQPRPDAIPMLKSEIELVFAGFGPDGAEIGTETGEHELDLALEHRDRIRPGLLLPQHGDDPLVQLERLEQLIQPSAVRGRGVLGEEGDELAVGVEGCRGACTAMAELLLGHRFPPETVAELVGQSLKDRGRLVTGVGVVDQHFEITVVRLREHGPHQVLDVAGTPVRGDEDRGFQVTAGHRRHSSCSRRSWLRLHEECRRCPAVTWKPRSSSPRTGVPATSRTW